jgi:hypothetical protein
MPRLALSAVRAPLAIRESLVKGEPISFPKDVLAGSIPSANLVIRNRIVSSSIFALFSALN